MLLLRFQLRTAHFCIYCGWGSAHCVCACAVCTRYCVLPCCIFGDIFTLAYDAVLYPCVCSRNSYIVRMYNSLKRNSGVVVFSFCVQIGALGSLLPGRDVVDPGGALGLFREAVEPHKSAHGRPRRQLGFVLNWFIRSPQFSGQREEQKTCAHATVRR